MTPLRILHAISEMGTGGAESLVVELVRRGAEVGWESAVASGGGRRADELIAAGVPHFASPVPRRSVRGVLRARSAAVRAVAAFRPDIVVAHNVSASLVTRIARPGVPVLTVFHGVAESDYRNAARVLRHTSDHVVAVAEVIANRLTDAGLRGVELTVIRNAVTTLPDPGRAAARQQLDIPAGVPVALCLARMVPQKRHDVLLDAWAQLAGDEILLLAGDGPQRRDLEAKAQPLGDRVRFLGSRSDVSVLLAAADVTVLTSDWEGLPISVLESLAAGRPVIATDVDGVRETLAPGGGRLVAPGDAAAVAAGLREMLHDDASRIEAARIGLATIRKSYDPASMVSRYNEVITQALSRKEFSCVH